jgi:hypothetical protein
VLTLRGLVTYYVLFFIYLESRRVDIAGITVHPEERWMQQIARNATMEGCGALRDCRYLLHDRDTKYTQSFRAIIVSGRIEPLVLPAAQPEPECLRGALGQVGEGGMPVQGGSLWRALAATGPAGNMSNITIPSGITRGKATSCCSLVTRRSAANSPCNAASASAGSCVITIRRRHERAGRLR